MNLIELIDSNKKQILPVLYEWAETFDFELDEEGEKTLEPYNQVFDLAVRFEKGECDSKDYQDIFFHIQQINYFEIKIRL
jgi:hypothetical protein